MERDVLIAIRDLVDSQRVLALAVIVDRQPEAAMLPYALRADYGAVFVQASGLARHARGLNAGETVGILIHANDTLDLDPMQLPRLMLRANVKVLERGTDEFASAAARFIDRFAGAKVTLALEDFNLYELTFEVGRYVEGFARAFDVGTDTFGEVASL
jgi:putative heme iron utilization protein